MASLFPATIGSWSFNKAVSCSLLLTESDIFLSGFHNDDSTLSHEHMTEAVLLRGTLQIVVLRPVKIRAIELELTPHAHIDWPQGAASYKRESFEEETFKPEVVTLFQAMDVNQPPHYGDLASSDRNHLARTSGMDEAFTSSIPKQARFYGRSRRRLSLQTEAYHGTRKSNMESRIVGDKSYNIFYPGTYNYAFEVPIYHNQVESIRLQYATVKWLLRASVHRAGLLASSVFGCEEISVIRLPDLMSLFISQPITMNRIWEGQLRYEILVSGSCFPVGSTIPIFAKFTSLTGVRVQKIEVYITEIVQYWSKDRHVTRRGATRKVLLFEKTLVMQPDSSKDSRYMGATSCGESITRESCPTEATACRRRDSESGQTSQNTELYLKATSSLCNQSIAPQSLCTFAEIEENIQIPTCAMAAKDRKYWLHPDSSWKNIEINHWIEILLSTNRSGEDRVGECPESDKITAQSPISILNCRASQRKTDLPAYPGSSTEFSQSRPVCGCPDAATVAFSAASSNNPNTHNAAGNSLDELLSAQPGAKSIDRRSDASVFGLVEASGVTRTACLEANVTASGTAEAWISTDENEPGGKPPPRYDQVTRPPQQNEGMIMG